MSESKRDRSESDVMHKTDSDAGVCVTATNVTPQEKAAALFRSTRALRLLMTLEDIQRKASRCSPLPPQMKELNQEDPSSNVTQRKQLLASIQQLEREVHKAATKAQKWRTIAVAQWLLFILSSASILFVTISM